MIPMPAWLTVKPLLAVIAALLLALGFMQLRVSWAHTATAKAETKAAKAETDLADLRADIAEQRETFERLARATEQRQATEMKAVATKHEQERQDAQADADRTIADLRSGAVRLRDEWAGCETAALVSGAAAGAGVADDAARLRQQGAADLVLIGQQCDAQVAGLQSAIRVMQGETP